MSKRLLKLLALGSVLLVCGVLSVRWLPGSAPAIRWKLASTVRSLPAPPTDAVLLAEIHGDASGSDCIGYVLYRVYGTNLSLADIADHYTRELGLRGWKTISEFDPDAPEAVYFRRGGDAFIGILTDRNMSFGRLVRDIPEGEAGRFALIYVLSVTRTCGTMEGG